MVGWDKKSFILTESGSRNVPLKFLNLNPYLCGILRVQSSDVELFINVYNYGTLVMGLDRQWVKVGDPPREYREESVIDGVSIRNKIKDDVDVQSKRTRRSVFTLGWETEEIKL